MSPIFSRSGPARPDLARLLSELQAALSPSRPVPLATWQAAVVAAWADRRPSTRARMGQALRETLAALPADATTADLAPGLVASLAARRGAAATTAGLLSSLRAACGFAARQGWMDPAQLAGAVWTVPPDPPRRRHHDRAAIRRVLAGLRAGASTWEGGRLHALAATYAYTGVRRNEALRLRVADLDLERGFLIVRPNGGRLKTAGSAAPVPMPSALVRILRDWSARCRSDWLFPGAKRRGPWTGGRHGHTATAQIVKAGRAAGVEGFTPQSLRHSLATHLRGFWGLSREQVGMVLRHTQLGTQEHYVHPDIVNLAAMVRAFDFDGPAPLLRRPTLRPWRHRPRRSYPAAA